MSRASKSIYDRPSATGPTRFPAESQEIMEEDLQDTTEAAPEQQLVRGGPAAAGRYQALGSSTPSTQSSKVSNNGGTDRDWEIAMSKRQKRRQRSDNKPQVLAGTPGNGNFPGAAKVTDGAPTAPEKKREGGGGAPRMRVPPLPRDDLKIVLRPRGLAVKSLQTHQVARAVVAATEQGCNAEDLIISSSDNEEAAQTIRRITHLSFGGKNYAVNAHVAAPEGTLRGVIHGVDPGTSPEELKTNIRVRTQGVKILAARMLRRSSTAVITFDGPILPKQMLYYGGGGDVVLPVSADEEGLLRLWPTGAPNGRLPEPGNQDLQTVRLPKPGGGAPVHAQVPAMRRQPRGGNERLQTTPQVSERAAMGTQQQLQRSRSRSRGRTPRWLRDESQGPGRSGSRSRSRDRSRSRGSVRDESYPPLGNTDKKQLKQKHQQKKGGGEVKVSWGDGPPESLFAAHSNNTQTTQDRQLIEEIKSLRRELEQSREELRQLKKQRNDLIREKQEMRAAYTPTSTPSPPPHTMELAQQNNEKGNTIDGIRSLTMNLQGQMQSQMQQMQSEMQQTQQKFALQEQSFRNYVKNQNTQRTTNDTRDRLYNERRFGAETPHATNNNQRW
ncbi:uncharacterized protein LOC142566789 [Dermacentor variabilis]|uniref:uncharacterized protein LOC142566789 n=1 Tax=Dermacentor variabilis TaxID=34621 RepID=UPI003F5BA17C